jgi:hypothetical protein
MHAGGIYRKWVFTRRRWRATRDLLVAVERMRTNWSENGEARDGELWRGLHARAENLREVLS